MRQRCNYAQIELECSDLSHRQLSFAVRQWCLNGTVHLPLDWVLLTLVEIVEWLDQACFDSVAADPVKS